MAVLQTYLTFDGCGFGHKDVSFIKILSFLLIERRMTAQFPFQQGSLFFNYFQDNEIKPDAAVDLYNVLSSTKVVLLLDGERAVTIY